MLLFYFPWKHQETKGFFMFSGDRMGRMDQIKNDRRMWQTDWILLHFFINIRNFEIAQKFFNKLIKIAPSSPPKNCLSIAD